METDIFPFSSRLVAAPYTGIALGAGPAVQRDDEWPGIVAVIRHDLSHICYTVQTEGVSCPHPCYVCFQYPHSGVSHFFYDVALQQGTYLGFGMKVGLCPQAYFHSITAGIVAQIFQVLYISV